MVTSAERLQRLLALVPYVVSRKVVGLAETAATFGMTERELIDDLNLLWCVELRAPDPYCPIDLSYEGGEIVGQPGRVDRPPAAARRRRGQRAAGRAADARRGARPEDRRAMPG